MNCKLCPHKCGTYKDNETESGICKVSTQIKVARIAPHYWEEPCLSGTKGSGAIFFSGCTMKCIYCQNYEISAENKGVKITPETLADEYKKLEESGIHNIDLISATQFLPEILRSFEIYKPKIPIVYNCGGYERVETLKSLEGIVDIYLPDFKYSCNTLALEYSGAVGYVETATAAIGEMLRQTGKLKLDNDGIAKRGVLVRHLVLPNHTKNSIGVINILKENFDDNITLSLMGQYIPHGKALSHPKLSRKITKREYEKVLDHLIDCGLEGYAQELKSADESYIPMWDYET
ncbi:MAG: radical SAM protein [Ruminococcus sp.]|nr:radical SAM protein [Ruminococcus sp.]